MVSVTADGLTYNMLLVFENKLDVNEYVLGNTIFDEIH